MNSNQLLLDCLWVLGPPAFRLIFMRLTHTHSRMLFSGHRGTLSLYAIRLLQHRHPPTATAPLQQDVIREMEKR